VLLPAAFWHLLRTEAWRQCFPDRRQIAFGRLCRVRLAAEAFSFVTIRGVAGEPLKVVWLGPEVPPMVAAAAVALERVAYIVVTMFCVGLFSALAMTMVPMPSVWLHIFGWLCGVSLAFVVISLILARRRGDESSGPTGPPRNVVARFFHQLAFQFRTLLASDRRRLLILLALELASFAAMAAEVWTVLAFAGTPVTIAGAVAIETFTRAASTASAFIPANLGALEASNVAAAVAMHAAAGASVLAIARRVRGLAFCAAGFLVYPRRPHRVSRANGPMLVVVEEPRPSIRVDSHLAGLPLGERICRAASRAGYSHVLVWSPQQRSAWSAIGKCLQPRIAVTVFDRQREWSEHIWALDPDVRMTILGRGIVPSPSSLGVEGAAPSPAEGTSGSVPTVRVATADDRIAAERKIREAVFKPTDDLLARFNRRISLPISIALIRTTRMSANVMSVIVIALGVYAGWLFSYGTYGRGVAAATLSLAASILDGCDGELARLQYKESALGCWIDTFGDYTYYIAIFAGLTVGAARQTGSPVLWWIGLALGAGVLMTFALLILLRWRATGGRPEQLRATTAAHFNASRKPWARTAVWLAGSATRATMPYGILAFAVLGLLPAVVVLATIGANAYWIVLATQLRSLLRGQSAAPARPPSPLSNHEQHGTQRAGRQTVLPKA
jgi:phosphatidylglycerophosphate synthase